MPPINRYAFDGLNKGVFFGPGGTGTANRERALGLMTGDSEIKLSTLARRMDVLSKCPSTQESLEIIWCNASSQTKMDPRHSSISGRSASSLELVRITSNLSSSLTTLVLVWIREGIVEQNVLSLLETASSASNTLRGGLSGVLPVVRAGPKTRVAMALVMAYSVKTSASSSASKTITEPAEQTSILDASW